MSESQTANLFDITARIKQLFLENGVDERQAELASIIYQSMAINAFNSNGITPLDFFEQLKIRLQDLSGSDTNVSRETETNVFLQLKRSSEKNIVKFADNAINNTNNLANQKAGDKEGFFIETKNGDVIISEDIPRHEENRKHNIEGKDWQALKDNIESGSIEFRESQKSRASNSGKVYIGKFTGKDGQVYGVIGEAVYSKKQNKAKFIIETLFKGTDNGVNAWINEKAASRTPAPLRLGQASVKNSGVLPIHSLNDILIEIKGSVNALNYDAFNQPAANESETESANVIDITKEFDELKDKSAAEKETVLNNALQGLIGAEIETKDGKIIGIKEPQATHAKDKVLKKHGKQERKDIALLQKLEGIIKQAV
ncbi:MAG: hypothetical protein LBQ47_02680, partial [Endomicrobium sp.]|nr:hypothetical protein [Endomicrobium sp.]